MPLKVEMAVHPAALLCVAAKKHKAHRALSKNRQYEQDYSRLIILNPRQTPLYRTGCCGTPAIRLAFDLASRRVFCRDLCRQYGILAHFLDLTDSACGSILQALESCRAI